MAGAWSRTGFVAGSRFEAASSQREGGKWKSRISCSAATEKCRLSADDGPRWSRWGGNPGTGANRCWAKPGLASRLRALVATSSTSTWRTQRNAAVGRGRVGGSAPAHHSHPGIFGI